MQGLPRQNELSVTEQSAVAAMDGRMASKIFSSGFGPLAHNFGANFNVAAAGVDAAPEPDMA